MTSVSVIIPTNNRPHLLPRAIESARAAATDVDVIVVDDASRDETADVCRALRGIRYIRLDHNQGVAGARNVGVLVSSSEYIALLDDDDERLPGSLDLQLAAFRENPAVGLVYGQALFGGATDRLSGDRYPQPCPSGDIFWQLLEQNFIPSGAAVFRRSCLLRTGLFDRSIAGIDDWDLWVRIAALYPVAALEQPVMIWRRPSPSSKQGSAEAVEIVRLSTKQFRQLWLKMPRVIEASVHDRRKAFRQFTQNMANHLVWEALRSISAGEIRRANRCLVTAMHLHPKGILWRTLRGLSKTSGKNRRVDSKVYTS